MTQINDIFLNNYNKILHTTVKELHIISSYFSRMHMDNVIGL